MPNSHGHCNAATNRQQASIWRAPSSLERFKSHGSWLRWKLTRLGRRAGQFEFRGSQYDYFHHRHNSTWKNERAVEIPIALRAVQECRGRRVLEVGNVLSHYVGTTHDIVDKYEVAPGVTNVDVTEFFPQQGYDLIICVSTLEHIGWDEVPREPRKVLRAIDRLVELLTPNGQLIATVPIGANPLLDSELKKGRTPFQELRFLKKTSKFNWIEVRDPSIWDCAYGHPFPAANGLVIGFSTKREVVKR